MPEFEQPHHHWRWAPIEVGVELITGRQGEVELGHRRKGRQRGATAQQQGHGQRRQSPE
ncbi:hypothetical protein D3C76_1806840 [compost metagenome]